MRLRSLDSDDISAVFAGLTFAGAFVGWLVNRYFVRRRRLSYRVHWNRPIEVTRPASARGMDLQIQWRRSSVSAPSLVVMRVENIGSFDVDASHIEQPLRFTFGGRRVVHYEVQDTEPKGLARQITEPPGGGPKLLAGPDGPERGLELPPVRMRKGDRFKLLVLLSGPGDEVDVDGYVAGGEITREGRAGARSRAGIALGSAALLFGGLLVGLLVTQDGDPGPTVADDVACPQAGPLGISGSSALHPAMAELAAVYRRHCSGAGIQVEPSSSEAAIEQLVQAGKLDDQAGQTANSRIRLAMADEPVDAPPNDRRLQYWAVGVGAFAVVVHEDTGVSRLTTEQLRRLYAGDLSRWDDPQLGGAARDVVLVGRSKGSGTRATFERRVLEGTTGARVSSNDCLAKDVAGRQGDVMYCELDGTQDVLRKVAATPGAIGYATLAEAEHLQGEKLRVVVVDGVYPDLAAVADGSYRFWAIEKLYRWGAPIAPTVRDHFVGWVTSNAEALGILRRHGFYLCTDPAFIDGEVAAACGPDSAGTPAVAPPAAGEAPTPGP